MTRRAAVIGAPVSHSRSPAIFSFVAEKSGVYDFEYTAKEILPDRLATFLAEMREDPSYVGINVTIPHKEIALAQMDELSSEARAIGAINVVRSSDRRLQGFNTDVVGIRQTLEDEACDVRDHDCLIWGAGGAARAVAYVLGDLGARRVFLWNRRYASAEVLASRFCALFSSTDFVPCVALSSIPRSSGSALRLIVNTTPAGMRGIPPQPEFFEPMAELPILSDALAFDLVYQPARTPFLAAARARGMQTSGGLRMLVDQALATWDLWLGRMGSTAALRACLLDFLRGPIFLTGFMGAGKSTIGAALASALGFRHVDIDEAIAISSGRSIPEIFSQSGEAEFRRMEKQAIAKVATSPRTVVSLGGGALMDPEVFTCVEQAGAGELIYLSAEPATIEERLRANANTGADTERPLLAGLTAEAKSVKIREMLKAREPTYVKATLVVSTDGRSPDEITSELIWRISESGSL